jgi:hypothetical protein
LTIYDPDDIARSVRRTIAELLGEPWQLDLERKEVADDARPAGVVEMGEARMRRARTSLQQGPVTSFAPVTVTLYPALAEPREAGRAARKLAHLLLDMVMIGVTGPTLEDPLLPGEPGRVASGPERLPLYDYENIPLVGTAAERRGPDFAHDVLWAEDYGVRPLQDPMDPQRWSVILEMRLSWERPGHDPDLDAPIVASLDPAQSIS